MDKFIEFVKEYWKSPAAIIIYIILGILIIYNWGRIKGAIINKPTKLPSDKGWGGDLTAAESENIRRLSQRLYRDMDSYMVSAGLKARDIEAYKQLLGMSDTEFVGVYNDFNDLYLKEEKGTLTQWIYDESFTFTLGASGDLRDTILEKMEKLNLGK